MLKFAAPQRHTWILARDGPVPWETPLSGFLFLLELTGCSGRKKVCRTKFVPEFWEPNVKAVDCETSLRNHGQESSFASSTVGMSETDTAGPRIASRRYLGHVWRMRHSKDPMIALATHLWLPTHYLCVMGEQKTCSCRDRVTNVAHECLRNASVAEQISFDVTVEEMWLFEKEKAFSCDEAVLARSYRLTTNHTPNFDDVEMHKVPKWRAKSRGSR